jgi:hypothetical protein
MVNKTHCFINIVSIEGWRTGFTESSVVQSVVGKSLRLVMTQWVRHLATSLLKSSIMTNKCQPDMPRIL